MINLVRRWVNSIQVKDYLLARSLCDLIPDQCPLQRDIKLFGKTLFHVPPMCKLNPIYDELMSLRFRALSYLELCRVETKRLPSGKWRIEVFYED
jgi:hypothetical protein